MKPILASPGKTYIIHDGFTGNMAGRLDTVLQDDIDDNGWPLGSVLVIRPYPKNDTVINIANNWISYEPNIDYNITLDAHEKYGWKLKDDDVSLNVQNSLQPNLNRHDFFERPPSPGEASMNFESINNCTSCSMKSRPGYLTNSFENIDTNFLVNVEYENISSQEIDINLTPLKNHLTPENIQSKSNPFPNYWDSDFRDYYKIFSGTNQIEGDSDLVLGYSSFTVKIDLPSDKLTYFHLPQDISPWEWVNINYRHAPTTVEGDIKFPSFYTDHNNPKFRDMVGLLEAGAIAGDTPLVSDKIFKKRADYKNNTNWGQSSDENGTWLCAWLCNLPTTGSKQFILDSERTGPVWLDRYYNPSMLAKKDALDATATCFDLYTAGAGSSLRNTGVVDIISHLKLEPGVLYAYHHIGKEDNKKIISSFDNALVHNNLVSYSSVSDNTVNSILPITETDNSVVYSFNNNAFGKTITPESPFTDFCISFWLHSEDWTKPFGHQIIGNYTNDGIGILNDECITPFITLLGDSEIEILNTDLTVLNTIPSNTYDSVLREHASMLETNLDITPHTNASPRWYTSSWFLSSAQVNDMYIPPINNNHIYVPGLGWVYMHPMGAATDSGIWLYSGDSWFWVSSVSSPWIYNNDVSWAGSPGWCYVEQEAVTEKIRVWSDTDSTWVYWKETTPVAGGIAPVQPVPVTSNFGNRPYIATGKTFYNGYNPVDDFTITTSVPALTSNIIYQFDTKGLLTEKTILDNTEEIISTTNDKKYIYALTTPAEVLKIDTKTETVSSVSDNITNISVDGQPPTHIEIDSNGMIYTVHCTSSPLNPAGSQVPPDIDINNNLYFTYL